MPSGLVGREAVLAELRAWQGVLPDSGGFTGLTALSVYGVPLPPLPAGLPHFAGIGLVRGEVKPDRRQLVVSRHGGLQVSEVDGVLVVPPAESLLECARHLTLLDLVCVADGVLRLPGVGLADLWPTPRRKGAPALRRALRLADARAESFWESMLRMLHVVLGVDVTPQVELFDEGGRFVARVDLMVDGTNAAHEYDGADHRGAVQHRKDLARERRILASGRVRRGYTSDVVLHQPQLVLRDCEHALGRRLDPSGIMRWAEMVGASLHARAGQQAVLRRMGRNGS